jgi:hypothetical protein
MAIGAAIAPFGQDDAGENAGHAGDPAMKCHQRDSGNADQGAAEQRLHGCESSDHEPVLSHTDGKLGISVELCCFIYSNVLMCQP